MKKHSQWFFIAAVLFLPLSVFAVFKWYEQRSTPLPVLANGRRIARFALTDQDGKTVGLPDWKNKIVVVNFFFSHCPVVCPKMMRNLQQVQAVYGRDSGFLINSFTVDPERDSSAQLHSFARRMNLRGNWLLLTGAKTTIYALARNSFFVTATDGDGGPQDFIHSEMLVLVDRQTRIRGCYRGTDPGDLANLIRDIRRLQQED